MTNEAIMNREAVFEFTDTFDEAIPAGQIVGRMSPAGIWRGGADVERVISSDHGALRIQPLLKPGWGRSGLAYGPYRRENGLAFGVHILNGHNTSQVGDLTESLPRRLYRWTAGSKTHSIPQRVLAWVRHGDKRRLGQEVRRWAYLNQHFRRVVDGVLDENLAVGWFPAEVPADPAGGSTFVVHATGAENGELWARASGRPLPAVRGLQNVPVYYVVVLRERGAAYYAASLPGAHGLGDYPLMRPLAIDAFDDEPEVYAGIYQSVLGQIGFRVDSRVYGTAVQKLPEWSDWFGSAHLADTLVGVGLLDGSAGAASGAWRVYRGGFERSGEGIVALAEENLAVLDGRVPAGLVHLLADTAVELVWRFQDEANFWSLAVDGESCRLLLRENGRLQEIARDEQGLAAGQASALQVLDDGETIAAFVDGRLLFDQRFEDGRLGDAAGVGLRTAAPGLCGVRQLEAHPRAVPIPTSLGFAPPWEPGETETAVRDDFQGPTADLQGHTAGNGTKIWQKSFGLGAIQVQSDGAKVVASAANPNPGRTLYTIPWDDPAFAELEVEIMPPGTRRGEWELGRGGLVFWQDEENQLIISTWLDDFYQGASMSSFFPLRGFEELYDAVWTNVGSRIRWGVSYRLRVACDGVRYLVYVNDEPVLMRALTDVYPQLERLRINRVGIAANWEWGNDTGSVFRQFAARKRKDNHGSR